MEKCIFVKTDVLSYEDCKEMVETCKENGVIFMAGHIMNFSLMVSIMLKN